MKITNFNPDGIPLALGGWSTGVVSLNSNVEIIGGGPQALNFVQRITSNTSNTLLNPIVNFAAGSNISLSAASNTITITGSGGGGGGGGSGAPTTAQYIVGASDATLTAERVRADLYVNYAPDAYPSGPAAENDEFDTGTPDGKWGWSSGSALALDNSTFPGFLYVSTDSSHPGAGTTYYRQSYAPGASTAFCIVTKVALTLKLNINNNNQVGLAALDSSDAEIAQVRLADSGTTGSAQSTRLVGADGTIVTMSHPASGFVYLALARDASNVYTGYYSLDGFIWMIVVGTATSSTTVSRVGYRVTRPTAGTNYIVSDYFRRFATSTPPFVIGS